MEVFQSVAAVNSRQSPYAKNGAKQMVRKSYFWKAIFRNLRRAENRVDRFLRLAKNDRGRGRFLIETQSFSMKINPFQSVLRNAATLFLGAILFSSCLFTRKPSGHFSLENAPPKPDYSKPDAWSSLPERADAADKIPPGLGLKDEQATAGADVFYLYPTSLIGNKWGENEWNADVFDKKLNKKTDQSAVQYQASIFNGAGRVFVPRYRQTHLFSFYTKRKKADAEPSLALAYEDLRAAFEFYLKNRNEGRPIILAAHSQGAYHGMLLLRDFFDGKPLADQLVAAYLVGWPVRKDFFQELKPCETPEQTGCICSWRTYGRGFEMKKWAHGSEIMVTNPLSWTTESGKIARCSMNKGGVVRKFKHIPECVDAEIHDGFLWASRPKFPGSWLLRTKNYHPGDFNLFYLNVRENAVLRAEKKLKSKI